MRFLRRLIRKSVRRSKQAPGTQQRTLEALESRTLLAGVTANYFADPRLANLDSTQIERTMSFDWATAPSQSNSTSSFGVRYVGRFAAPSTDTYTFSIRSNAGVRLWVNGQLLIDNWRMRNLGYLRGDIQLESGKRYDIRLDTFSSGVPTSLKLYWNRPGEDARLVNRSTTNELTNDRRAPSRPRDLTASYTSDTALVLNWSPSTDSGTGITGYDIFQGTTHRGSTTDTSFSMGGLNPQSAYKMYVRAIDASGNFIFSSPITITTQPRVPTANGTGLAAKYFNGPNLDAYHLTRTDSHLNFEWEQPPVPGSGPDPNTAQFSAEWHGKVIAQYNELYTLSIQTTSGVRVYLDNDLVIDRWSNTQLREFSASRMLAAHTEHEVRIEYSHVSPTDPSVKLWWSSLSTPKQLIPQSQLKPAFVDSQPPTAPTNLRVTGTTATTIALAWNPSGDDVGVVGYEIYRNNVFLGTTSTTSFLDTGLTPGTNYQYRFSAFDGRQQASPPVTIGAGTQGAVTIDATSVIPASSFNGSSGVSVTGGGNVGSFDNNDWIRFDNINFQSGMNSVRISLACPVGNQDGTIELRLGSPTGTLIGSLVVQATGSWTNFFVQRANVNAPAGVHSLYLVGKNQSNIADIKNIQFSQQRLTRIMSIGDSITESSSGYKSYRYYLHKSLLNAGRGVDFVGTRTVNWNGPAPDLDFDQNHQGHYGWRTDQILANITSYANATSPEIATIHLGTNDILQGVAVSTAINNISQIIDRLRLNNPSIRIVLCQIIPIANSGYHAAVNSFNQQIVALANSKNTSQSRVISVDCFTGMNAQTDLADGVHPSTSGEQKMAAAIFGGLQQVLPS